MKSSDRTILSVVGCLALVAAFWFLVLSPKREEASELSEQVSTLQAQVAQAEASVATATAAKEEFKPNYRKLITLGKAVPVDADTPSLLTQLQTLSSRSDVAFQGISLGGSASSAPVSEPTTSITGVPLETGAATEASASLLPIGATVGSAGLPIMPYTLQFTGGFFDIARFFGGVDDMVTIDRDGKVAVDGRLLTINSFTMSVLDGEVGKDRKLDVSVDATSYLSPADQGITGGATATGPLATPVTESPTTQPVTPAVVGR